VSVPGAPLHPRAAELIARLALEPHIEGGRFRRLHASAQRSASPGRPAVTSIHYLLTAGEVSRWHQVDADEIWHFLEGDPLELLSLDVERARIERRRLGPASADQAPVIVIEAGCWQAARPLGAYALTGCTVAPGFDYDGYRLLEDAPDVAERLRALAPDLLDLA